MHSSSAALCDEQGLGKTLTSLQILRHFCSKTAKFLLIVPKQLVNNWMYEIKRMQTNDFSIFLYFGLEQQRKEARAMFKN